ncbi:MAG TPA: lasso peptide biosynthesis B2 protein [Blastocatellia bacterium]|nr:lasso peptide biosynthesis B2 protein [Blastocatellia bacterium]
MGLVRRFLRLSRTERRLLIESVFLIGTIRVGLWVLPFKTLHRLVARRGVVAARPQASLSAAKRVAWAVEVASRYVPFSTCLTRAMATMILLGRNGQPGRLRIGVAKNREGRLEAHAWVESQGRIIIGSLSDLSRYSVLSSLKEESS